MGEDGEEVESLGINVVEERRGENAQHHAREENAAVYKCERCTFVWTQAQRYKGYFLAVDTARKLEVRAYKGGRGMKGSQRYNIATEHRETR